jgi:two-component system LytT family response regulator
MKRLRSIIIDDERLARVTLRKRLSIFPNIEIIGEATSVRTAVTAIAELNPELIFLDIQLSDGTGFDVLERVKFGGKVVFVTAFDEYAIRAFELNALDYLLKPISKERLANLISRINSINITRNEKVASKFSYDDRIMIEQKGYIHFLLVKDILLVSSAKDYSLITSADNKRFIVTSSMNEWEQKLPQEHFFRANRTAIVNLNLVEKTIRVGATADIYVKYHSNEPIHISRNSYKYLREKYYYK